MPHHTKQSKRKHHVIYQISNLKDGKIYIGAHSTDYLDDDYMGSGTVVRRVIKKYGTDSLKKTILHVFDSFQEMYDKEREIVNEEFICRPDTYNIVVGGGGGPNKGTVGQIRMYNPLSNIRTTVPKDDVDSFIENGWVKGFSTRSRTGSICINKNGVMKGCSKEELPAMLLDGWQKGMLQSPTKNKHWIFSSELNQYKIVDPTEIDQYLQNGWIKKKQSPCKGSVYVNNGTVRKRVPTYQVAEYEASGWQVGWKT